MCVTNHMGDIHYLLWTNELLTCGLTRLVDIGLPRNLKGYIVQDWPNSKVHKSPTGLDSQKALKSGRNKIKPNLRLEKDSCLFIII